MYGFMAACWGLHKKGSLYDGLLRALTRAAETLHEQERLHRIAAFLASRGPAAGRARYLRMRSMARGPDSHAGVLRRA